MLAHTLAAFAGHPGVDAVRAVIRADDRAHYDRAAAGLDLLEPVIGGAERARIRPGSGSKASPKWRPTGC